MESPHPAFQNKKKTNKKKKRLYQKKVDLTGAFITLSNIKGFFFLPNIEYKKRTSVSGCFPRNPTHFLSFHRLHFDLMSKF